MCVCLFVFSYPPCVFVGFLWVLWCPPTNRMLIADSKLALSVVVQVEFMVVCISVLAL